MNRTDEAGTSRGPDESGFHFVQSVERALAVIECFDAEQPELTMSAVARKTGMNRAAARRFLLTLAELGYVRNDRGRFSLTPKTLNLGYAYLSALSVPEIATPHLRTLANTIGESSYLSVLEGRETVCVANYPVHRIWSRVLTVGTRLPALATASGRMLLAGRSQEWIEEFLSQATESQFTPFTITDNKKLLAELEAIRSQGWALVDQELEEGIRTVAVPLNTSGNPPDIALSISKLAGTSAAEETQDELLPPLLNAARNISTDLRRAGSGPG